MSGRATAVWLANGGGGELEVARQAAAGHLELSTASTVAEAETLLRERPLRMLLMAQQRRGVWSESDCERLHQAAPLTQLVGVHGSWCEGWQRTGHPWRGVEHVYWHQLPARLPVMLAGAASPRTATAADLPGADLPGAAALNLGGRGRAAVSAPPAARDALGDLLATIGWQVVAAAAAAEAAVWDGDPRRDDDLRRLLELAEQHGAAPRLALTVAPRLPDWELLEQHVDMIISKPFAAADLLHWPGWRAAQAPAAEPARRSTTRAQA